MTKNTYENPFAKMFGDMPVDMNAFNDVFKNSAAMGEKFAKVALAAAEKNAEIANKWTKETLVKVAAEPKPRPSLLTIRKLSPTLHRLRLKLLPSMLLPSLKLRKKFRWTQLNC